MTTTSLLKTPRWSQSEPHERSRQVASQWGSEGTRARDIHVPHPTGRPGKARGYAQKIRLYKLEVTQAEPALQRAHENSRVELERTFDTLKDQWLAATAFASATVDIVLNDAYQQIIGLGPAALPLILRELEKNGGQWFWALRMITRQDPVPKELRGKTKQMAEAWVNWAKEQQII
ncbi:hypothetical protein [Burkholderia cepacia]|uniref:hypothetical protein n=1 Tax=Burkholderia cepacia TaxID=292 RepID=UPI0012D8694E|nr:hypothetical protein [Burkholderia cepacia]